MISIANYIGKIFNYLVPKNEEAEVENEDVAVFLTTSVKRRPEENTQDEMIKKRKKLGAPASAKNDADPCLSSYLSISTISDYQKENQQLVSDNLNINQILRRRQKSPRMRSPEIYCIDDDDCGLQKQHFILPPSGMTLRSRNYSTSMDKSSSGEDFMTVGETHRTYSRPNKLVFPKVQSMRDQSILMKMFQNQCSISKKSVPLTNSTVHNTKLNRSFPSVSKNGNFIRRRSLLNCPALSPGTKSLNLTVQPGESTFDKVANVTIDLTNEDDEDQRLAIESKVISSSEIRNMKSSFVAPEDSYALDENLIPDMIRKFEIRLQNMEIRASKFKKDLANQKAEMVNSFSEILDKRLTLKEHEVEKEDVAQKSSMEIAPITKEMINEMNTILASRKSPLVQIKDTSVKLQDIRTLENTSWLNDEVINAYMNLIKLRSEESPKKYPKVHCFNTFLYAQLSKKGYMSVRRWTRKVDIFDYEILIIPIHLGNHWCLTQIRFPEKIILYYDSMGSPNNRCLNTMLQYLIEEYKDKKNGEFDISNWTLRNEPYEEIPQQKNAYDCGVFACTFAEHLTRNSPLNFDQDHMQYFRYKMMYEILTGKLLL